MFYKYVTQFIQHNARKASQITLADTARHNHRSNERNVCPFVMRWVLDEDMHVSHGTAQSYKMIDTGGIESSDWTKTSLV